MMFAVGSSKGLFFLQQKNIIKRKTFKDAVRIFTSYYIIIHISHFLPCSFGIFIFKSAFDGYAGL